MSTLDAAAIERLRENSHIHLDRDGRFWHEGTLVEHPRVAEAFHRGLGRAADGRPTLTIGRTWCYITADDVLYRVRRALCEEDGQGRLRSCLLRLDDGSEELLALANGVLRVNGEGVLYSRVKDGREWACLIPEAQVSLGRFVQAENGASPLLQTSSGDFRVEGSSS